MRFVSRARLAVGLVVFYVLRVGYYAAFGAANGFPPEAVLTALAIETKQYVVAALVVVAVVWRPTGSGALATLVGDLVRSKRSLDRSSLRPGAALLELVGTVLIAVGVAGTAFFAQLPGRYANRHSLAGELGVASVAGLDGTAFFGLVLSGLLVWLLPLVADAIDVSDDPVYRQAD